jgi:hypothetical protein
MITEIADATGQLIHLVDDLLHQTQTRRLDTALNQASTDVQNFKDDLLARRLESLNLRLAGLQHGILVHVTVAESEQLHALQPGLDGFALLGLYARARAADLAAECAELLSLGAAGNGASTTNASLAPVALGGSPADITPGAAHGGSATVGASTPAATP